MPLAVTKSLSYIRMGAKSKSTAFQGPYTREDGYLGYNEICELIGNNNNIDNSNADGWAVKIDEFAKAPFMFRGQKWVSYDDEESVKTKARYDIFFFHFCSTVPVCVMKGNDV